MKFGFSNARTTEGTQPLSTLEEYRTKLRDVVQSGKYEEPESVINLPGDADLRRETMERARVEQGRLSYIVVVGIGGSNAGTRAIYNALGGHYGEYDAPTPHMLFSETVDARLMKRMKTLLTSIQTPEEILVCVVSKSGHTIETLANADVLFDILTEHFGDHARERFVAITAEGSPLWEQARTQSVLALPIPSVVSGRYSVLSSVGLFPLACAGFDIDALHEGARDMRDTCLQEEDNRAQQSALTLFNSLREGYSIHDTFLFDPAFEALGYWYRQLLAESTGKSTTQSGEEVLGVLTPTVSIGSRDLHSVAQLVLSSKQTHVTTFVRRTAVQPAHTVPPHGIFHQGAPELAGHSDEKIFSTLAESAKQAYAEAGLPFIDVEFESLSEYELGAFMQWKMCEVMYLSQLMDVNAFDQPAVEGYKKHAQGILSNEVS